jgi:DNA-binding PadR family transcriptional regulator
VGSSLRLTKPTAYRILHNLADKGLIHFREEKDGNRPTRRIYSLTPKGEKELETKLKESLSTFIPLENASAIGLAFLNLLPHRERISLLERRQSEISELLETLMGATDEDETFKLITENRILHLSAELAWLTDILGEMKAST